MIIDHHDHLGSHERIDQKEPCEGRARDSPALEREGGIESLLAFEREIDEVNLDHLAGRF